MESKQATPNLQDSQRWEKAFRKNDDEITDIEIESQQILRRRCQRWKK